MIKGGRVRRPDHRDDESDRALDDERSKSAEWWGRGVKTVGATRNRYGQHYRKRRDLRAGARASSTVYAHAPVGSTLYALWTSCRWYNGHAEAEGGMERRRAKLDETPDRLIRVTLRNACAVIEFAGATDVRRWTTVAQNSWSARHPRCRRGLTRRLGAGTIRRAGREDAWNTTGNAAIRAQIA